MRGVRRDGWMISQSFKNPWTTRSLDKSASCSIITDGSPGSLLALPLFETLKTAAGMLTTWLPNAGGVGVGVTERWKSEWSWAAELDVMTSWCRTELSGGINGENSSTRDHSVCVSVCSSHSYVMDSSEIQTNKHAERRHTTWPRCQSGLPLCVTHTPGSENVTRAPKI